MRQSYPLLFRLSASLGFFITSQLSSGGTGVATAAARTVASLTTRTTAFHRSSSSTRSAALAFRPASTLSSSTDSTVTSEAASTMMNTNDNEVDDPYNLPPLSATCKRIFWVRHGEVINPGAAQNRSVYYGAQDVPLSALGQQEARVAATYLSSRSVMAASNVIAAVYSSTLSRAVYGAEQVCRLLNQTADNNNTTGTNTLTVQQLPGFKELDRGVWAGLTLQEIGVDTLARFDACDETVTPENGESYSTLYERVLQARNHVVLPQLGLGEAAVVVSHLQVTRCVVSDALDIPMHKMASLKIGTASITCIDYEYDGDVEMNEKDPGQPIPIKQQRVLFQSFKPQSELQASKDGAN